METTQLARQVTRHVVLVARQTRVCQSLSDRKLSDSLLVLSIVSLRYSKLIKLTSSKLTSNTKLIDSSDSCRRRDRVSQ